MTEIFGFEISQTATFWTAIGGIVGTISTTIWGIIERRQKHKAQEITNKKGKFDILDIITERYKELLKDFQIGQEFNSKIFEYQIEFCRKNLEEFIKFINNKNQKDESSNNSRS